MKSTIYAPATPAARSAVAVLRVSGPGARWAVEALAGAVPQPRRASLRTLRYEDQALDQALVLWMPGPASFTGEDSAEFHLHGGLAVVGAVAAALSALGMEAAAPGAFTQRAFENGKLDLSEAEGLADLIDAETESQRLQALEQLGGALGRRHETWRSLAIEALAYLEAAIDFPDEDLPADVAARAGPPLQTLRADIEATLAASPRGEIVRDGYRIALLGAPNAGKSSLLNALAGRDAAIVTDIPGTTRDVIEVPLSLDGFRAVLADTAGLRETADVVEAEGVRRARAWANAAHLRLWLRAPDDPDQSPPELQAGDLILDTKADLHAPARGGVQVSVKSGESLNSLRELLSERVRAAAVGADFPAITRERHRAALTQAAGHLARAESALLHPELAAEDVRLGLRAMEMISGRFTPDDVLDRLFRTFCVGK